MEHIEHNLEERAVERFNAREQEQVTVSEWRASVDRAHDGIADRRIVEVTGAMACAELQGAKYIHALRLMDQHIIMDKITVSEWRDGRIGKRTIDNYTRDILKSDDSWSLRCGADYTEICSVMNKLLISEDHEVVITNEPSAFLRMGCQSIDNNSCYRATHECQLAPLIIAENRGSFIGYIKHPSEDKVMARCWGIERDGDWFFTNVYARGIMTYTASAIFTAALRVVCNTPNTLIVAPSVDRPADVYLNGDIQSTRDQWAMVGNDMHTSERGYCHWCEENCIDEIDGGSYADDIGNICCGCCDDAFVWSDYSNTYIVSERATLLYDGEYCPTDCAVELYDGEYASDEHDVTQIQAGNHKGDYALDDDDALRYTACCNESYIEGSI